MLCALSLRNIALKTRPLAATSSRARCFSSSAFQHLTVEHKGSAVWVSLNRPTLFNAFNEHVIDEITRAFKQIDPATCRSAVLTGNGSAFSAGADLNWMQKMVKYSEADNRKDSEQLFDMFHSIRSCPVPVIARVNGAALGGGAGLVAACDFAYALDTALFGFTEVKLGLIPAVISRFVMDKIGKGHASRFFLTGERFNAETAQRIGLIQAAFPSSAELDAEIQKSIDEISKNSPAAMRECKKLIETVCTASIEGSRDIVTQTIARARVSAEGQEGVLSFLEKRKPSFIKKW